jgi:hypothetical protein
VGSSTASVAHPSRIAHVNARRRFAPQDEVVGFGQTLI